jgi:hypothetical protein
MDKNQALSLLRLNQPLPSDDELDEELITGYNEARAYFVENPDPAVIPLFLNSFGDGDGLGIYPLVEDVFESFSTEQMTPHLLQAMQSEYPSVVYWSTQVADLFPHSSLIPQFQKLLSHDDAGIRAAAVQALRPIDDPRVDDILASALGAETDPTVIREIKEVMEYRA